ncbi:MAG: hypothetical protein K6V73_11640 [Firmicutes bacterium]|nr:hypothetical protein [Bacillota bacterium]
MSRKPRAAAPAAAAPAGVRVVLTGGAFPNVAVLHWGRLRYAIVARDRQAISMLSDNGSMTDDARDVVYLAVSTPEVIARYRAQGYTIFRAEPADPSWQTVLLVPAP